MLTLKQGLWTLTAVIVVVTILFAVFAYYIGSQVDF